MGEEHKTSAECQIKFDDIREKLAKENEAINELRVILTTFMEGISKIVHGNGKEPLVIRLDRLEKFADDIMKFRSELQRAVISNIVRVAIAAILSFLIMAVGAIYTMRVSTANKEELMNIVREVRNEVQVISDDASASKP